MAQLLAGGAFAAGTVAVAAGGVFYLQPHSVIARLVEGFPRVVWCLSAESPPFMHTGSGGGGDDAPDQDARNGSLSALTPPPARPPRPLNEGGSDTHVADGRAEVETNGDLRPASAPLVASSPTPPLPPRPETPLFLAGLAESQPPSAAYASAAAVAAAEHSMAWTEFQRMLSVAAAAAANSTPGRRRRRRRLRRASTSGGAADDGLAPHARRRSEPIGSTPDPVLRHSRLASGPALSARAPGAWPSPTFGLRRASREDLDVEMMERGLAMADGIEDDDDGLLAQAPGNEDDTDGAEDDEDIAAGAEPLPRLPGISRRLVALTIDDTPSEYTAEILDILKEHGCRATFFVIGEHIEKHPDGDAIMRRIVEEGHELGNHTWFDRPTIRLPTSVFEEELVRLDEVIQRYNALRPTPSAGPPLPPHPAASGNSLSAYGLPETAAPLAPPSPPAQKPTKWFRPGSGLFSREMLDIAERHGYRTVLGCRFPVDTTSREPRLNAWHVCAGLHPGAIVVLHDCRHHTLATLRILLPAVAARGYAVATVSAAYAAAAAGGDGDDGLLNGLDGFDDVDAAGRRRSGSRQRWWRGVANGLSSASAALSAGSRAAAASVAALARDRLRRPLPFIAAGDGDDLEDAGVLADVQLAEAGRAAGIAPAPQPPDPDDLVEVSVVSLPDGGGGGDDPRGMGSGGDDGDGDLASLRPGRSPWRL
ncbi:hypothetical protein HK405_007276 [Cladochytrium tenue]|nr:hypothetical protein HK405_007276 [Cladochytrium tenue]